MSGARPAFHVAAAAYYLVILQLIQENMIKHKDDENLSTAVKDMQRFSQRFLTNWTFVSFYYYY